MSAESVSTSTTYRRLLGYSARYWPIAIVAFIGMIFDAGCGAMFTFLIKPMLDELFDRHDPVMIFWMPIIIIALFVVRGVATFSADYGVARIGRGVVQTMREEVFAKYLRMPASFFHREAAGSLIARMTYTVEQVANASTDALKVALMDGFMVIGQACVMLYWSPRLTLVLLLLAPLVAIVVFTVGRRYRRISKTIQESVGSITGIIDEAVTGHREVKIYGGQSYEQGRFNAVNAAIRRLNMKVSTTNAFSTAMIQIVASVALALVIFLATRPGIHEMTSGIFMSVITAMLVMLPSLKRLTTVQANLQRGVVAARDVFELIDSPDERDTGSEKLERCKGDVEFRDVSFRYPGTTTTVLEGITLRCAPGTVTALVGRSGSGKSSLAGLLPRFYDPDAGSISLDGHPLSSYALASLRAQIALVSQQVVLFNDTVARNIAYGSLGRAGESEIAAAAEAANAMEFVKRMPNGMLSRIGDAGALLSGGQRQRIAIARAILKDAPILILDEATSALDSESERLIQDALKNLLSNRTVLVIAHRLSTIEHADQIVVLDEGRIIEIGKHAELLARNGHYALLHRMQFRDTGGCDALAMLDERALQEIWYGGRPPGIALRFLAALFGALSGLRRRLYGWKILSRVRLGVPVIVVGNITVGGTGKTPLVIALIEALRERGWKPGVITRGYAGNSRGVVRVDADSDPEIVGDEAKLVFESVRVPVMVGRDRVAAGRALIETAKADVIVADDGLQHYRLGRDVEICVIDGHRRFGNGRLLPAGPLREKESRLAYVDFRICNGESAERGEVAMRLLGDTAVALDDRGRTRSLGDFVGERVHAVAGIGNPARFFAMLRATGLDVIEHAFPDHHAFKKSDLDFGDGLPVLMTEKDAVKCRQFARYGIWSVPVKANVPASFFDGVSDRCRRTG